MRVTSDEHPRRFKPVWIGNNSFEWPFHATYQAWCLFGGIFVSLLLAEAVLPFWSVSVIPAYEFVVALLAATYLSGLVTPDRPLRSIWGPLWRDVTAPRHANTQPYRRVICTYLIRVDRDPV